MITNQNIPSRVVAILASLSASLIVGIDARRRVNPNKHPPSPSGFERVRIPTFRLPRLQYNAPTPTNLFFSHSCSGYDRLDIATRIAPQSTMPEVSSWLRGQRKYELVELAQEAGLRECARALRSLRTASAMDTADRIAATRASRKPNWKPRWTNSFAPTRRPYRSIPCSIRSTRAVDPPRRPSS